MKRFANIRENDDQKKKKIYLGIEKYRDDEGVSGYQVVASNEDDVGYYRAQTADKCIADIGAMWERWETYREKRP